MSACELIKSKCLWVASCRPGHMCPALVQWKQNNWGLRGNHQDGSAQEYPFHSFSLQCRFCERPGFIHFPRTKSVLSVFSLFLVADNCLVQTWGNWQTLGLKSPKGSLSAALHTYWKRPLDTGKLCVWSGSREPVSTKPWGASRGGRETWDEILRLRNCIQNRSCVPCGLRKFILTLGCMCIYVSVCNHASEREWVHECMHACV